jgi:hypothetical protein
MDANDGEDVGGYTLGKSSEEEEDEVVNGVDDDEARAASLPGSP